MSLDLTVCKNMAGAFSLALTSRRQCLRHKLLPQITPSLQFRFWYRLTFYSLDVHQSHSFVVCISYYRQTFIAFKLYLH